MLHPSGIYMGVRQELFSTGHLLPSPQYSCVYMTVISGVLPRGLFTFYFFLRTGSLTGSELPKYARLAGQQAQGPVCLHLPSTVLAMWVLAITQVPNALSSPTFANRKVREYW